MTGVINTLWATSFLVLTFCLNAHAIPGDLDTTFGTNGKVFTEIGGSSTAYDMAVQADGKIVVAGTSFSLDSLDVALARYNADGSLDTSFGIGGRVQRVEGNTQYGRCLVIRPDGKIIVIGQEGPDNPSNPAIFQFNSNGSIDTSFGTNGKALLDTGRGSGWDAVLQPDGKIVVAGHISTDFTVFRFNSDGTADTTFNTTGYNTFPNSWYANAVALQSDGKIIVGGSRSLLDIGMWGRFNSDGTLEGSLIETTGLDIRDVAIQPDGKIVIVGRSIAMFSSGAWISRYNADKSLDRTFGNLGKNIVSFREFPLESSEANSVAIQPDGRIIIGGYAFNNNPISFASARFNSNGFLDVGYGDSGKVETSMAATGNGNGQQINSLFIQPDGKVLAAGFNRNPAGTILSFALARYHGGGSNTLPNRAAFDYDGDGRSDISVYRPSTNVWYVYLSRTSSFDIRQFGTVGDIPVPADFTADGRTDVSVYRPSSNTLWFQYFLSSTNLKATAGSSNAGNNTPLPSDFDGDGRADYVFFYPASGFWNRKSSSTATFSNVTFGSPGDKPLIGDFDGDGRSDPAIYRPSTGEWWYRSSINSAQLATRWGISTDIPTPADYDGDGKSDFAVYRSSDGVWYIYNSSTGSPTIVPFGLPEDKPVPADYDGDGRVDIAVFRPSTGIWYLLRSTAGFAALQFGVSTDIPTPNVFVP